MSAPKRTESHRWSTNANLERVTSEVYGPLEDRVDHRFRRYLRFELHVKPPWDVPLAFGILGGLSTLALVGALVIIWTGASIPGILGGVAMLAVAAGLSSHFAARLGVISNTPGTTLQSR